MTPLARFTLLRPITELARSIRGSGQSSHYVLHVHHIRCHPRGLRLCSKHHFGIRRPRPDCCFQHDQMKFCCVLHFFTVLCQDSALPDIQKSSVLQIEKKMCLKRRAKVQEHVCFNSGSKSTEVPLYSDRDMHVVNGKAFNTPRREEEIGFGANSGPLMKLSSPLRCCKFA